ncbi:modifier of rudimentary (Mod(r)) protein [Artemisia annua]|uniref:Modifier of rudimentary (Mod(R)) protein n=1 Tax=Artemisia annua TaxID=35608 RepID=A0A2U1QPE3_ARTAN|nr:modifier of rudimentary (Mod(r)) protein [Artemisia annua]
MKLEAEMGGFGDSNWSVWTGAFLAVVAGADQAFFDRIRRLGLWFKGVVKGKWCSSRGVVRCGSEVGFIGCGSEVCVDDLRKLSSDPEAYQHFLLSMEPVRTQNKVRDDLQNQTIQLASKFLT